MDMILDNWLNDIMNKTEEIKRQKRKALDMLNTNFPRDLLYKGGGAIPGYGIGDKVPIMAEPGEYVIPKEVVEEKGIQYFDKMIDKPVGYQMGGRIPKGWIRPEEIIGVGGEGRIMPPEPTQRDFFDNWYANMAKQYGLNPNPYDSQHFYDYKAAYDAGVRQPNEEGHWPSQFKLPGHPNETIEGVNTRTGQIAYPKNIGIWQKYQAGGIVEPKEILRKLLAKYDVNPMERTHTYQPGIAGRMGSFNWAAPTTQPQTIPQTEPKMGFPTDVIQERNLPIEPKETMGYIETGEAVTPLYKGGVGGAYAGVPLTEAEIEAMTPKGRELPQAGILDKSSPYDRQIMENALGDISQKYVAEKQWPGIDVWRGMKPYKGTMEGGVYKEKQAETPQEEATRLAGDITKTVNVYNAKGNVIGTKEVPDVEAQARVIAGFGVGEKEPYPIGHIEKFNVGDKEVYKQYMGKGQWQTVEDIGGPRYKQESMRDMSFKYDRVDKGNMSRAHQEAMTKTKLKYPKAQMGFSIDATGGISLSMPDDSEAFAYYTKQRQSLHNKYNKRSEKLGALPKGYAMEEPVEPEQVAPPQKRRPLSEFER